MIKLELNITEDQLDLLKNILFNKSIELDKKETDLLVCTDFILDQDNLKECEILLKDTQTDISNLNTLLHQIDNNCI